MTFFAGRRLPRWLGGLMHLIVQPAVHAGIPWLTSRGAVRHGWEAGAPGFWNFAGLVLALPGCCVMIWCFIEHFRAAPQGWKIERTPHYPTPAYLVTTGPYRYSRNPFYLAEGAIWAGWIVFYGSLLVLAVFSLGTIAGPLILRREERGLEERFGEAWRDYRRSTPRWLGGFRRAGVRGPRV